ncbi:hypothetical protein Lal_00023149 [Lupinus albus]|uniref:Putative chromatin regulator PHD family n=1 Tax=Lupinus albus TaxID=3870 RepID=A0A6A5N1G9_LUPAL|nr:putative chromatin regulator PHD family [Lupinus albus]KAF1881116.1 hypothetical protein Lal_00023149 [Lupinus albus]
MRSGSLLEDSNTVRSLRLRKKHKRLDAIYEEECNRNHGEFNEDDDIDNDNDDDALNHDAGVRRSSRVRRAPVLLDASPPPPRKRRRIGESGMQRGVESVKSLERENGSSSVGAESPGTWNSRLRSRVRNAGVEVKEKRESRVRNVGFEAERERESHRGKRKLFEDVVGSVGDEELKVVQVDDNEDLDDVEVNNKEEREGSITEIVKSKKLGRIDVTKIESRGSLDVSKSQEMELVLDKDNDEESASIPENKLLGAKDILDGDAPPLLENEERNLSNNFQTEECCGGIEPSLVECGDKPDDQLESLKEGQNASGVAEIVPKHVEIEGSVDKEVDIDRNDLKDANVARMGELKQASNDEPGLRRIKEGRRCGLCGGGTDGKPPKRLAHDNGESENEAYSGSSASEEPNYDVWDGFGDEPGWLGRLLGPINDRDGIARIWVHQLCAVWSPEVYFAGLGCLKNVRAALFRGRALKCSSCGRRGATTGCRVDRCPKTYHLSCARANGCIFDHRKFLIACTDHRHLFQPRGSKYLVHMRAKKMKWEMKKRSNDALRKDIGEEERWLENCGEDEEFLKRESKRLHRDLLRIAPVYIGDSDSAPEKSFQGWESIAGLKEVIRCMKEVVILPLLYPELFDNLGLTPPRGVLLHGYPGTGKTLVVRALIGACARGNKRIAYFARKGADCLGKYVGDAERQLRLLFQVAEKCQPSIIFFDEIDGLAPCRTRHQDQTHSSVVSTLLALMDGLKSRGSVVVIGATNRPDAVDPALRRPGRFDREIYFPLPSVEDRASILSVHTQRWPKPISGSLHEWIARKTLGYAGADLQALCTQAAINALKRNFPLHEVLSAAEEKHASCKHLPLPFFAVEERDWLEAFLCSPLPCSRREAGNAANDVVCSPLPIHLIPCLMRPLCTLLVSLYLDERLWLPPPISKAVTMIKAVIISALDKKKMSTHQWWLYVDDFLQETQIAWEAKRKLACSGILSVNNCFTDSHDTVDDTDDGEVKVEPSMENNFNMRKCLLPNMSFGLTNQSGFRILISGNTRSGQRHLTSCLLYCFNESLEIQKIDMATISQEGHGDVVQGIAQILMKCASLKSCIVFMPRIDLWAVEKHFQIDERTGSCSTTRLLPRKEKSCFTSSQDEKENKLNTKKNSENVTNGEADIKASHAWLSFIQQVEFIGVSTSLMILASSEIPYAEFPCNIKEFFQAYQSNDSQSIPLVQTVPRFSLQVDGNFDHDMVINVSAAEVLRNLVEQQVQLIHKKSHAHIGVIKGYGAYDSIEICKDKVCKRKDNGSTNEKQSQIQLPESLTKVPPPSNNRSLKGKSTLLSAISTFGYQILLYPHFAELCWVTSNFKEGPCADVNGPWRGWPFNSCIIRPNNSQDQVVDSSSSGGIKNKERSGIVRGLTAVGLSAYRGVYKSVREVSLNVRKVLEILIEHINAKIQAGKDRHQYLRILSQVAYLEDMVNNWAYALLSLEQDSPELVQKVTPATVGSLNSHLTCEDHQTEAEHCHLVVPKNGDDLKALERSHKGIAAEMTGSIALNGKNDNLDNLDHNGRNASSEGSLQSHYLSDKHINNSASSNQPVNPSINQESRLPFGLSEPVTVCEQEGVEIGNCNTISNQPLSSSSLETGVKLSDGSDHGKGDNVIDINAASSEASDHAKSGVICLYQCCHGCISSLYHLTQKLLLREYRLNNSHWTVEDVHDAVASLSVDLISALRKCYLAEDLSDSSNKTSRHEKHGRTCNPLNQGKDVVPAECFSHSTMQDATGGKDEALKLDLKFIFKDGVLMHMDPDKDVPLHCKFENLCLCSVRELIEMMKQPFD